jgi:hypothetical protein
MSTDPRSPFETPAAEIKRLLVDDAPLFPEFPRDRQQFDRILNEPHGQALLADANAVLTDVEHIPQTTFSRYQAFFQRGEREPYQDAYFLKRHRVNALVTQFLLGRTKRKDLMEDYLWAICEETTWVVPAHARVIDLMAAETALWLAEATHLLGGALDDEVRRRIRREIDNRIFTPFLQSHFDLRWFNGADNWNGVCSGAIGGALLYLEDDPDRLARAVALVLESLDTYLSTAFEADGGTTEGVGYWRYGLNNVVIFAEMLRARTHGVVDLLVDPRFRQISTFPAKMLLPNDRFVSFSDCPTEVPLSPGIVARLAERTGDTSLLSLLSPASTLYHEAGGPRGLRNLLWWDGHRHQDGPQCDALLPATGIARLTGTTNHGAPIVLIIKAGHNGENHNHNDIGSFVLNIGGEDFLTDPGPGRIDRDYFRDETRYNNLFANSKGHGVPVIDGQSQGTGPAFVGSLRTIEHDEARGQKAVEVEYARAYSLLGLERAKRRLTLDERQNVIWLEDRFRFADDDHEVEDVLVTWLPVTVEGAAAVIHGNHHRLRVSIEAPFGAAFSLESLADESRANEKSEVLQRIRARIRGGTTIQLRLRLQIEPGVDRLTPFESRR